MNNFVSKNNNKMGPLPRSGEKWLIIVQNKISVWYVLLSMGKVNHEQEEEAGR